jgi:hypothetical protein
VLSKHLPLLARDFNVVASATALITINIAAAVAAHLGHPPLSHFVPNSPKPFGVIKYLYPLVQRYV